MPVFKPGSMTKKVVEFGNANANHGQILVGPSYQISFSSNFIQFLSVLLRGRGGLSHTLLKVKSKFILATRISKHAKSSRNFGLSEHAQQLSFKMCLSNSFGLLNFYFFCAKNMGFSY